MYLTLNLVRVLAYVEENLVLSKQEGGEWALNNIPDEFHSLVNDSLLEYTQNKDVFYIVSAKKYANYMIKRINNKL